jgi:hypothetical protein
MTRHVTTPSTDPRQPRRDRTSVRWFAAGVVLIVLTWPVCICIGDEFAVRVIAYDPAPGQFVNHPQFNDPARALGPPIGGGVGAADNTSVVTLGGFGGSITLSFDHTVEDDPLNPYGMDAIVFGNAFWLGGDADAHWAECATIEISADANRNGLADDSWFLIPGSHLSDPAAHWRVVAWDDDVEDDLLPPHEASWIPPGASGWWETAAFALPLDPFGAIVVRNPIADGEREGVFGYADYSPTLIIGDLDGDSIVDDGTITPELFYTVPDDPKRVGLSPGSGGGDAFDIAWAIDPDSGEPAELAGFDFIRLTTAVDRTDGAIGEVSAEIDAAADAAPDLFGDLDDDGDIDLVDVQRMQMCIGLPIAPHGGCDRVDRDGDGWGTLKDVRWIVGRMTGPR